MKNDPGFVSDFRDRELAILAINMIVSFQQSDFTYKKMAEYPGFSNLFKKTWRNKDIALKLKNMVRDLREFKKPLNDEWIGAQSFFLGRKRK